MGILKFAGNALFRASVCGAAYVGSVAGAMSVGDGDVHTWSVGAASTFLAVPVVGEITIPAKLAATFTFVTAHFPTLAALLSAIKIGAVAVVMIVPIMHFVNWLGGERGFPPSVKKIIDDSRVTMTLQSWSQNRKWNISTERLYLINRSFRMPCQFLCPLTMKPWRPLAIG